MDMSQIAALILLSTFYISYIAKMLILKKQNIKGDILGKGQKPQGEAAFEVGMKIMLYLGAAVQFFSVIFENVILSVPAYPTMREDGLILMLLGTVAFLLAIIAMKNNWRAGYSDEQNTQLVKNGIYKFSRNPAFFGFDFLYLGCALAFPNILNIVFALTAIVLFHIQILGEEAFLTKTFGVDYEAYKARTFRYLGMKKGN